MGEFYITLEEILEVIFNLPIAVLISLFVFGGVIVYSIKFILTHSSYNRKTPLENMLRSSYIDSSRSVKKLRKMKKTTNHTRETVLENKNMITDMYTLVKSAHVMLKNLSNKQSLTMSEEK